MSLQVASWVRSFARYVQRALSLGRSFDVDVWPFQMCVVAVGIDDAQVIEIDRSGLAGEVDFELHVCMCACDQP